MARRTPKQNTALFLQDSSAHLSCHPPEKLLILQWEFPILSCVSVALSPSKMEWSSITCRIVNPIGGGERVCTGCCQYYLRKMEACKSQPASSVSLYVQILSNLTMSLHYRSCFCFCADHSGYKAGDEPPHQIHSYTLLFSLFLHFPYIADPPLCTSAPT